MPETTSGLWDPGDVYRRVAQGTWAQTRILLSATPAPSATITTYPGYIVFQFNSSATLNVGAGNPGTADVLLVSGGASGTNGAQLGAPLPGPYGGNGGAGGTIKEQPAITITANSPIPVVVGGTATNSTFGPLSSTPGTAGGSGGLGAIPLGSPTPRPNGQYGVDGPTNNYRTGSPQFYAGGGGGGAISNGTFGYGGSGGGGNGGAIIPRPVPSGGPYGAPGDAGSANTGGGGGGGAKSNNSPIIGTGGLGGSGVVVARFPDTQFRTA